MKMRASLTQRGDEIKGTIELGCDPAFNLEALYLVVDRVATTHKVPVDQVLKDLWLIMLKEKGNG